MRFQVLRGLDPYSVIVTTALVGGFMLMKDTVRSIDIKYQIHKVFPQTYTSDLTGSDQAMNGRFRKMMNGTKHCQKLHFGSAGLESAVLASFPGSGNTWLRHLIEEATGLFTGSIYNDKALKKDFPGEGMAKDGVVVFKSHLVRMKGVENDRRVILLVRNPFKVSMAEYSRERRQSHTGTMGQTFKWTQGWSNFYMTNSRLWMSFHLAWLKRKNPMIVVTYENLKNNTIHEMRRIVKFLNLKTSEDILKCMVYNSEGLYHRKSIPMAADTFRGEMISNTTRYIGLINKIMEEKYGVTIDGTVPTNHTG